MHTETFNKLATQTLNIQKIIWAALNMSVLMIVFVAFSIGDSSSGNVENSDNLKYIFYVISIGIAFIAQFIRKLLFSPDKLKNLLSPEKIDKLKNNPTYSKFIDETLQKPEQDKILRIVSNFLPLLFSLVLHESITILGFVLSTMMNNPNEIILFAVASLLLNLSIYPRLDKFDDYV